MKLLFGFLKILSLLSSMILITSCASSPEEISTTHVSPARYMNYDCEQVSMEMRHVGRQVNDLHFELQEEADADAAQMSVGLILFWPTLFFLEGGDDVRAGEYSRLKGEKIALEDAAAMKKCDPNTLPKFEDPAEILKAKRAEQSSDKIDVDL